MINDQYLAVSHFNEGWLLVSRGLEENGGSLQWRQLWQAQDLRPRLGALQAADSKRESLPSYQT